MAQKIDTSVQIPFKFLKPIKDFLEKELVKMKRTEKSVNNSDPFKDEYRGIRNSTEDDLDEQIGHFDTEIRAGFVKKQVVQLRKALTRMKIGKYGICEKCGQMIDTDRLAVKPETTLCLDCAKDLES